MKVDQEKLKQQNLSRAMNRSANERTFLSWMRSAIALMGFGVVIVRLRVVQIPVQHLHGTGWKLGLVFSLVGLATVLISTGQYFIVRLQFGCQLIGDWSNLFYLCSRREPEQFCHTRLIAKSTSGRILHHLSPIDIFVPPRK
jgi:uncharacterized membrane protein YidH (DUF202 family)